MDILLGALIFIAIIATLSAFAWMIFDVWENIGIGGCLVMGIICILLSPILPLILLGYIFLRHKFYGNSALTESTERVNQWTWRGAQTDGGQTGQRIPQISAAESDENIDILLAEGKRDEAMRRAKESYDIAQSFGDINGMERYRKYLEYIQRGGGLAGR